MASSCPYCGAPLKLKFCVFCGRQSKLNKMGQLRRGGRNTDATTRLEDPFIVDENVLNKNPRFRTSIMPFLIAALGGVVAGILIFCAGKEALNLCNGVTLALPSTPWMHSLRIHFPKDWPMHLPSLNQQKTESSSRGRRYNRHQRYSNRKE